TATSRGQIKGPLLEASISLFVKYSRGAQPLGPLDLGSSPRDRLGCTSWLGEKGAVWIKEIMQAEPVVTYPCSWPSVSVACPFHGPGDSAQMQPHPASSAGGGLVPAWAAVLLMPLPQQVQFKRVQWACAHAQQRLPQSRNIEREQGGMPGECMVRQGGGGFTLRFLQEAIAQDGGRLQQRLRGARCFMQVPRHVRQGFESSASSDNKGRPNAIQSAEGSARPPWNLDKCHPQVTAEDSNVQTHSSHGALSRVGPGPECTVSCVRAATGRPRSPVLADSPLLTPWYSQHKAGDERREPFVSVPAEYELEFLLPDFVPARGCGDRIRDIPVALLTVFKPSSSGTLLERAPEAAVSRQQPKERSHEEIPQELLSSLTLTSELGVGAQNGPPSWTSVDLGQPAQMHRGAEPPAGGQNAVPAVRGALCGDDGHHLLQRACDISLPVLVTGATLSSTQEPLEKSLPLAPTEPPDTVHSVSTILHPHQQGTGLQLSCGPDRIHSPDSSSEPGLVLMTSTSWESGQTVNMGDSQVSAQLLIQGGYCRR
ncbi:unnamed protein product, partial [Rangifer tarandus platyrhynchus]